MSLVQKYAHFLYQCVTEYHHSISPITTKREKPHYQHNINVTQFNMHLKLLHCQHGIFGTIQRGIMKVSVT